VNYNRRITYVALFLLGIGATIYAASSSTYYFKYFSTSGSISTWYTNDNSWGVVAPSGTGFVAMVTGEDWGTYSPVHTLPKKLNALSASHDTWFYQTAAPASGSGYDACYDIFIDPDEAPTGRNSINEVMIWVAHASPNSPLSNNYGSNGLPVPFESNVSLGGKSWDVYVFTWSNGGHTISYVDRANSGWWSGPLTPFFNHGIANGWYTGEQYLNSVMAGWEFGYGNYWATSWGAEGF